MSEELEKARAVLESERKERMRLCNEAIAKALQEHKCELQTFEIKINGVVQQHGWRVIAVE